MTQSPEEPSDGPATFSAPPQGHPWIPPGPPDAGYPPAFQPYPPPYPGGYPPPYAGLTPPAPGPRNGLGTASLVIGMLALLLAWLPLGGFMLGVTALVTGIAARRRVKRGEATNNGVTIVGIVLSTAATLIGGATALVLLILIVDYQDCIEHARGRYEYGQC